MPPFKCFHNVNHCLCCLSNYSRYIFIRTLGGTSWFLRNENLFISQCKLGLSGLSYSYFTLLRSHDPYYGFKWTLLSFLTVWKSRIDHSHEMVIKSKTGNQLWHIGNFKLSRTCLHLFIYMRVDQILKVKAVKGLCTWIYVSMHTFSWELNIHGPSTSESNFWQRRCNVSSEWKRQC